MKQQSARPLIAVDIGNSALKAAVFPATRGSKLPRAKREVRLNHRRPLADLTPHLPPPPSDWAVIRVHGAAERKLTQWVQRQRPQDHYRRLHGSDFPVVLNVANPDRVGVDRVAAAVAANQLRCQGQPAIVIDVGTAITVDLLDGDGQFCGGAILPGVQTAAISLNANTDALPMVPDIDLEQLPAAAGRTTDAAIRAGVVWGAIGGVRELVAQMSRQLPATPHLFCTGGGGAGMARQLGSDAQYDANLVLRGIAHAVRWQASRPDVVPYPPERDE